MPYCSNCGKEIAPNSKFCNECGVPVNRTGNPTSREAVYEGNIHKCPNCGELVQAFETTCKSCGFEFRDSSSSHAVKEFSQKLDSLEAKRKSPSTLGNLAKSFGVGKSDNVEEQILNHIRNFNVPNTKEDVFEFMILASSNINSSVLSANNSSDAGANSPEELNILKARNDAWIAKVEQVYQKASLSFGTDDDFKRIQNIYDKTMLSISNAKKEKAKKTFKILIPMIIMVVLCVSFFAGSAISHSVKEHKLEQTVQEIQIDIQNEDYDAALIKAQSLHMDDDWSDESKEHWDEQRESLIELIEEKQGEK